MISALQPAHALVDPVSAVPAAVSSRGWVWPTLFLMAAVSFSGVAFALRWNAAPQVAGELSMSGQLGNTTDKELDDKITTAARTRLVAGAARGVFLVPVLVLLLAVILKFAGWVISRPIAFVDALTAGAIGLAPIAAYHLVFGSVALASESLSMAQRETLIPHHLGHLLARLSPSMARLASVLDVFNLWSAALIGLGFSRGTGLSRSKGVIVGLVLYAMFAGVFLVGLPGMGGGPK